MEFCKKYMLCKHSNDKVFFAGIFEFIRKKNYSILITLLFLVFVGLSNIALPGIAYGEAGYIEALQTILIVSVLIVGFIRKSYLVNTYSRLTYWLRQSIFSFLFFEEISYLTKNKFEFLDYNVQSELNFHNSHFLVNSFASLTLMGNDAIHLHPELIIILIIVVILFSGASIPSFKKFRIIALHPLTRIGILFYPLNLAFSYLIRNPFFLSSTFFIVNSELMELFVYIIFLMDIFIKSYPCLISNSYKQI